MAELIFSSATEKYLHSRNHFRVKAKQDFFDRNPKIAPLISAVNEYVAVVMLSLSGQDMKPIPNGLYMGDLVVSFTRTHFIIVDLVVCSELIEAATLSRKQFELLARLNELYAAETLEHLLQRTPNLSALKTNLRHLYAEYSQIAHSASNKSLRLLGDIECADGCRTVVYPVFQANAHASLQHVVMTVFEYYIWAHQFLQNHCPKYESGWGTNWLESTIGIYKEAYV